MQRSTSHSVEVFRADCAELAGVLLGSGSTRLRKLSWCGLRVLDICNAPERYLNQLEQKGTPPRLSHGFVSPYQPIEFRGASSDRGSKWFLPGIDSTPFPCVPSSLIQVLKRDKKLFQDDYLKVSSLMSTHPDCDEVVESGEWQAFIVFGPQGLHRALQGGFALSCTDLLSHREFCRPFGFCMFLSMGERSSLRPHVGSTNMRLRCHLGISAPNSSLSLLTVEGITKHWREGEVVLFDDSFQHSSRNLGGRSRVVLSIDIWHPLITEEERHVLSAEIFSRFGKFRTIT